MRASLGYGREREQGIKPVKYSIFFHRSRDWWGRIWVGGWVITRFCRELQGSQDIIMCVWRQCKMDSTTWSAPRVSTKKLFSFSIFQTKYWLRRTCKSCLSLMNATWRCMLTCDYLSWRAGGNAGAAAAYAARKLKTPCTIITPSSTPAVMIQRLKDTGANVEVHGAVSLSFFFSGYSLRYRGCLKASKQVRHKYGFCCDIWSCSEIWQADSSDGNKMSLCFSSSSREKSLQKRVWKSTPPPPPCLSSFLSPNNCILNPWKISTMCWAAIYSTKYVLCVFFSLSVFSIGGGRGWTFIVCGMTFLPACMKHKLQARTFSA